MAIALLAVMAALALCGAALAAEIPLPSSPYAAARNDLWTVIGPGGGGGQFYPTVSPHDPNIVFVRCDMTGAYITKDGGEFWRMFNLRTTASMFVFDPVDPDVMYAYMNGLFRSTDSGDTWRLVYPNPAVTTGITVSGDHAGWWWNVEDGAVGRLTAFAVDPADSHSLYAVIDARLVHSGDWGETWSLVRELPRGGMRVYVDPASPKADRTLYVVTRNAVSMREGGRWTDFDAPADVAAFKDASAGWPRDGGRPVIYATADAAWKDGELVGGIMVSRDGGQSWSSHNQDFAREMMKDAPPPTLRAIATCLTDPSVAYASYVNVRFGTARWDFYFGTAKSVDYGRTWDLIIKDTYYKASPAMQDAWMNEYYHPEWGEAPFNLGVAPTDPDICYGTDFGRTMRTTDGLKTWVGVYSKPLGDGWATTGLDVTTCYGAHRDPHDPRRLFITYTDMGLFRSEDGGTSWVHAVEGITPSGWANTTYWMVFDPDVAGRVWAGSGANHDLPRPKMWRGRADVSHYRGGVVMSNNGGRSWRVSNEGMQQTDITHLILDPASPADARVLYAAGFGTGVWKSTDSGASWTLKRQGLPGREPFAWRLHMDPDGVLYLVVARRSEDGSYGNEQDGALYRSRDGADTWEEIPLPERVNGPNGIHVDPRDPQRLYLACWGRGAHGVAATDGGIYLSTDGGATWNNIFDENQFVYDVTADPSDHDVLYACGFESSAWRSADRGQTWNRIRGFNFKWGHRVMVDPVFPGMIFVSTFGGSVWYGPAAGDPDAPEDIVTPHLSYEALGR